MTSKMDIKDQGRIRGESQRGAAGAERLQRRSVLPCGAQHDGANTGK